MLVEMQDLARHHSLCVLATSAGDQPYCSLMAYVANDACSELYMVTQRSTRKFRNILANPSVSLMIDTRHEVPRHQVRALTIEGSCAPVTDPVEDERIRIRLLATHPQLSQLLSRGDCALLRITITAFLLLKGPTEAHYRKIG